VLLPVLIDVAELALYASPFLLLAGGAALVTSRRRPAQA